MTAPVALVRVSGIDECGLKLRAGTIRRVICKYGDGVEIDFHGEPLLLMCGEYRWVRGKDTALRRYQAEKLGLVAPEVTLKRKEANADV